MNLQVENLYLRRGARRLVQNLSFELQQGQSLLLKGPNGVGKTTLIRAIAGFHPPEQGRIHLNFTTREGQPETDQTKDGKEYIHYIGHKNGIRASLTVLENLEFWSEFFETTTSILEIANKYSLKTLLHIPAGYLSAGQKRRLSLSRLGLSKRPLWLLDEPTVSLDQKSVKLVANAASDHVKQGGILIAATHIPLELPFSKTIELKKPTDQSWEPLI